MKRAIREGDPWSGQISLPGGHKDDEDGDLLATAIRETLEEVGVPLKQVSEHLGRLESVEVKPKRPKGATHVHPFVFVLNEDVDFKLSSEATKVFWLSFQQIRDGEIDGKHKFTHLGNDVLLPSWNVDGEVVWGLTYKMIKRLDGLLGNS